MQLEKEGLRTYTVELDVAGNESLSAEVDLLPINTPFPACSQSTASWIPCGRLVVAARDGARTIVDGEALGIGHVECMLPVGEHDVRVSTSAVTVFRRSVTIAAGQAFAVRGAAMLGLTLGMKIPNWDEERAKRGLAPRTIPQELGTVDAIKRTLERLEPSVTVTQGKAPSAEALAAAEAQLGIQFPDDYK